MKTKMLHVDQHYNAFFSELNRMKLRPVDPNSLAVPADAIDPRVTGGVTDGLGFRASGVGGITV